MFWRDNYNSQPSALNSQPPLGVCMIQRREGNSVATARFTRGSVGSKLELISVRPQEFLKIELARSARVRHRA